MASGRTGLPAIDKAHELNRGDEQAVSLMIEIGRALQATGRYEEAIDALAGAIALKPEPGSVSAWVQLQVNAGKGAEAAALLERLMAEAGEHMEHWLRLKASLMLPQDRTAGTALLHESVRQTLARQPLREGLVRILEGIGGRAESEDLLQRVLEHWSEVLSAEDLRAAFA